jgi:hypothetical protein
MLAAAEKVNVMLELYTADVIPPDVPALQLTPSSGTAGGTLGSDESGAPVALVKLSKVKASADKFTTGVGVYRCNIILVAGLKLTMYSRSLRSPASGTTIGILNLAFLSYISSRVQKWLF